MKIEYIAVDALQPYGRNARKHGEEDVQAIVESIKEFGFNDPIGLWSDKNIIVEGHGRLLAAKLLNMEYVPCIRLDHLTDEQRRGYALAHNKTAELSRWDDGMLDIELGDITDIDMSLFGFERDDGSDFFELRERNDTSRQDGNDEYNEFLDKFEIAKTTDDCYTPDNVYEAVAEWVRNEFNLADAPFVRPFYPGGDYQRYKYPKNAVVVDNPPFSIYSQIVEFYVKNGIRFFMFAPALNVINYTNRKGVCAVCTQAGILYENGATVPTSFLTNLCDENIAAITAPDLYAAIDSANDVNEKAQRKSLPKYEYPDEVLTSAKMGWLGKYGQKLVITREESIMIRALDSQKESGQSIYGCGLLISERAAAERAAAERAAAERAAAERAAATKWKLSEREKAIVRSLGKAD